MRNHRPLGNSGFTLVEILAVVAILGILVGIMSALFDNSNRVRTREQARAMTHMTGMGALELIQNDIRLAMADHLLSFRLRQDSAMESYGATCSEMYCVSLRDEAPTTNRAVRAIAYWVEPMAAVDGVLSNRFRLVRAAHAIRDPADTNAADNVYWNQGWYKDEGLGGVGRSLSNESSVVAENVGAFLLRARTADGQLTDNYASVAQGSNLPLFVDILLELMDSQTARQAAALSNRGASPADLIDRRAFRFYGRAAPLRHRELPCP